MQGQRHEVAGRHTRQLQARMGLEAKARVVRWIAQQHAACGLHSPQFSQRLFHQARANALSLPCRQDGDRPQAAPAFGLVAVVVGGSHRRQSHMADDLAVFFGHDGKRQFASVAQCTHDELLRVAGVRRIGEGGPEHGKVIAGFAGATADAFTLFERLERKLEQHRGQLMRAAVELAKDWRTDKYLRNLEAMLIVSDGSALYVLTGAGDVLEPEHVVPALDPIAHPVIAAGAARGSVLLGLSLTAAARDDR